MSSQDLKGEVQNMGEKLLVKLKQIPQTDTLEIISFTIILVFIAVVLLMAILACCFCCCTKKHCVVTVQPKPQM